MSGLAVNGAQRGRAYSTAYSAAREVQAGEDSAAREVQAGEGSGQHGSGCGTVQMCSG
jgi:hypothetical protein